MQRFIKWVQRGLSALLVVLMTAMVLDVTWQVITRFLLRHPSSFTEELAGFLLVWIGLLGACYALQTRAHLGIDLLASRVSDASRKWVELVVYSLVGLFAFFVMVIGGLRLMWLAFQLNQISAAMGLKMGYVYLAVPISGVLMIIYSTGYITKAFTGRSVG